MLARAVTTRLMPVPVHPNWKVTALPAVAETRPDRFSSSLLGAGGVLDVSEIFRLYITVPASRIAPAHDVTVVGMVLLPSSKSIMYKPLEGMVKPAAAAVMPLSKSVLSNVKAVMAPKAMEVPESRIAALGRARTEALTASTDASAASTSSAKVWKTAGLMTSPAHGYSMP